MLTPPLAIAFIGLGAMGRPMAANLARAQFRVRGFDLHENARKKFANAAPQAEVFASAREAAAGADALVLMVVDAGQAEDALFQAGALEALKADALVILMATCAPQAVQEIAKRVAAAGRRFVDAPVSGGVVGAEAASLTIMIGAAKADAEAARPVLSALGSKLFHIGETPGQGALMKTLNQLLCGVHLAAAAEAFALAEQAGIDKALALKILSGSAAQSWMLNDRGPRMLESAPEVTSTVDIFVKDLGLVMDAGRSLNAALPLSAAALQMFLAASGAGHGKADDSQVIRAYRALNGTARPAKE